MTKLKKLLISLGVLLVLAAVLVYVNNPRIISDAPPVDSRLEPRVLSRWDALIDRNFEQAYEYFSPAYRKLFPLENYLAKTGSSVAWVSIKIKGIQFDGQRAEVKLVLEYRLILPMGAGEDFGQIPKDIDEVWLWIDGDWWYTKAGDGRL